MARIGRLLARREFAKNRDEFYEDTAQAIRAGASMDEILRGLAERALESGEKGLAEMYGDWAENLGDAATRGSFAEAIVEDVPTSDAMVLRGFEASGKTADGLAELSKLVRNGRKMTSAMMGAVAAPSLSLLVILGVSGFFGTSIMPVLAGTVSVDKWPALGVGVYYFATFVANYWWVILLSLIVFGKIFVWSLDNWQGSLRRKVDAISFLPYNLYKNYQSGTLLIVLSALLKSGASMDGALRLLAESGGRWMSMYLSDSIDMLGSSHRTDPASAFDTGFFPRRVLWRLQDAAKRSSFPDAVKTIADTAFDKLSASIIMQANIMNKASMMIAGILLLSVFGGVLQVAMNMRELMGM